MFVLLAKIVLQIQFINVQLCKEKTASYQSNLLYFSFIPSGAQNVPLRSGDIGQGSLRSGKLWPLPHLMPGVCA